MLDENRILHFLNSPVRNFTGVGSVNGKLFGLELELEGRGVGLEDVPSKNWRRVADGSLRGESMEYVFSTPCEYDEAVKRVKRLFAIMDKHKVRLKNSYRTSTHVHLNFADKQVKQLINFFLIHTVFEELFEHYCGEDRGGNLFCLSARANEELIRLLEEAVFRTANLRSFNNDRRYIAANICSINKFGSMEIRTMRGADNADMVVDWMNILNQLYEYVLKDDAPSPARIAENLSHLGVDNFLAQFFDEESVEKLIKSWPKVKDLGASLLEGVRLIQMFAYRLDEYWNREYSAPANLKSATIKNLGRHFTDLIFSTISARREVEVPLAVNTEHRQMVPLSPRRTARFNADTNCWWLLDDMGDETAPLRWVRYRGTNLITGSNLDEEANAEYYDRYGWPNQDEEDPDWDDEE